MTGRGDPPEGTPEGIPGGDDEYRSVVFDESFVRAARIQEFSASERMGADARAVRTRRRGWPVSRQAVALVLLIVLAFGTAVYMGIRHPYQEPAPTPPQELAITLMPLAPSPGQSPAAGTPERLFASGPVAEYRTGADGVTLPAARHTEHYSESQVMQALTAAKEYLVASSVDPEVLLGGGIREVRRMLDPAQQAQFDQSLERPSDDGSHAATGWMVRFDPKRVELADPRVRVDGSMEIEEGPSKALEVVTDHTFVYVVRPVVEKPSGKGGGDEESVLFTVRRELRMEFDKAALRDAHLTLVGSAAEAGPQLCTADGSEYFQPVLAGDPVAEGANSGTGKGGDGQPSGGTNPFDHKRPVTSVCGVLSTASSAS